MMKNSNNNNNNNNRVTRVFFGMFRRLGTNSLWYLGIFAAVMGILYTIFRITEVTDQIALAEVLNFSNPIYMLVVGVVYPLIYLESYIAVGVTRREFVLGLYAAAFAMSLCFSLLFAAISAIAGVFSLFAVLSHLESCLLLFLTGWIALTGFPFQRWYLPVLSVFSAVTLFNGLNVLTNLIPASEWVKLTILFVAVIIAGFVLNRVVRRVPVKC